MSNLPSSHKDRLSKFASLRRWGSEWRRFVPKKHPEFKILIQVWVTLTKRFFTYITLQVVMCPANLHLCLPQVTSISCWPPSSRAITPTVRSSPTATASTGFSPVWGQQARAPACWMCCTASLSTPPRLSTWWRCVSPCHELHHILLSPVC